MDWQYEYEKAAEYEKLEYEELPVEKLIENISQEQFGTYNMIWRVLAERATLTQVGWPLFHVLQLEVDYLIRCNCAEALLTLLGRDDILVILREAVALTSDSLAERMAQLATLEQELILRIRVASK